MKTINFEKYNLNNDKIFSAMGEMFNARIESAEGIYGIDLHNHIFNSEESFIYNDEAEEACDSVGTWSAIRLVSTYEKDNFGEVSSEILQGQGDIDKELLRGLENDYDVDLVKILTEEENNRGNK